MLNELINKIKNRFSDVNTEAEGEEKLEHDIVMIRQDGKLVEVTGDDSEVQQQE